MSRKRPSGFVLGALVAMTAMSGALWAQSRGEEDKQQAFLDQLRGDRGPLAPPRGVDPDVWRALSPKNNQLTKTRVILGRKLFFDKRLSRDGTVSCATCHDARRAFAEGRMVSEGIGGQLGRRNAPTAANAAFLQTQFLDGRSPSLEAQAKLPILNPIEMGQKSPRDAVAAIAKDPVYQAMFKEAYGGGVNFNDLARAIAAFERSLIFLDSPFDRWLAGDEKAMSAEAKAGFALFNGKARCVSCHPINGSNPVGSDNRFHNIGIAAQNTGFEKLARQALKLLEKDNSTEAIDKLALETDLSELGRFLVTRSRSDIGAFKTSQLRNVGLTGPYMHDGFLGTLWDVMDHYNKGGVVNPFLDGGIEALNLSEKEIDQLVAFMVALTDVRFAEAQKRELARQKAKVAKARPHRDQARAERKTLPFERRVLGGDKKKEEKK